jgi:ferredoxin
VSELDAPTWLVTVLGFDGGDGGPDEAGAEARTEFTASPRSSLVVSASQAGLRLPASCRNGSCRACMCKLLSGQIDYLIEWPGLLAEEKAEGWILPCVALPRSDLVIHQPAARRVAID